MARLNYHHLFYFWTVAREGSVASACRSLHLTQPTLSAQIRALEDALGQKLFLRSGRRLVLTDVGKVVLRYAEEIFTIGGELQEALEGAPPGRPQRLAVGIDDALPKLVAYRIIEPVLSLLEPVRVVCHEGGTERLLADLATYDLDLVLTDAPMGSGVRVRGHNHLLGQSAISCFAAEPLASVHGSDFPASLHGAPFLMPASNTSLRRSLDRWFHAEGIEPLVVAEFDDSALMQVFGQAGTGVFAAPSVIGATLQAQYGVAMLGRLPSLSESYYGITVARQLDHPGVRAIVDTARHTLSDIGGAPKTGR